MQSPRFKRFVWNSLIVQHTHSYLDGFNTPLLSMTLIFMFWYLL
ncbi:hypothetical protein BVI434_310016 [Burkholderia vietnamiensis]|nr:hypothetical protein BVI434_310016 [Burkholderia vietnamiensis]